MTKIISSILVFMLSATLWAQDMQYTRDIIGKMASVDFKGRGYVDNGVQIAADFINQEFQKIRLQSFGDNYNQEFDVSVNTFPSKLFLKIDDTELFPGVDYLVDPSSPSIKGDFPILLIKLEELSEENAISKISEFGENKILIIDAREYEQKNKKINKELNDKLDYLKFDEKLLTIGTIILSNNKLMWGVSSVQATKPVVTINKNFEIKANATVSIQIRARFFQSYKTANIAGYIQGTSVPDSFLVVTAHYDHLGMMGEKTYFPGANDNASGVAMLLNLAKYFKENPPKYSVAFIALAAEELGLVGARYYTDNPLFDLSKIKFLVNFDLAGTGNEGIKVVNASVFNKEFKQLTALNNTNEYLKSVQSRGPACNSDHCMFYNKNVPCFYIYTLGGIRAYHDIYDRPETLPLTAFENYYKLMIDFFKQL